MENKLEGLLSLLWRNSGKGVIAIGIISLAMNAFILVLPIYSLQVFDRVLLSRSSATLLYLTLIVVVFITAYAFLESARLKLLLRISNRFQIEFERSALGACISRSAKLAEVVTHPMRDLSIVRNFLSGPQGIVALIDTPLAFIFLIVVYFIHPLLAGAMLLGIVILMLIAVATEWSTAASVRAARDAELASQSRAAEIVRNAELVEAMGMNCSMLDRWQMCSKRGLYYQSIGSDRSALLTALGRWDRLIIGIALTGLGAYLAIDDRITVGGMIAASMLMGRGLAPLENLIPNWRQFIGVRQAWRQLNDALQNFPRSENSTSLPTPLGSLSIEQVTYIPYSGDAPTIHSVSLQVKPGTQLGIVGPVSAGKSTLAKLICGIWKPRAGTVRLDNADVYQWNRGDFGKHVGYLPQGAELFTGTVRDNIARFGDARDEDVVAAAKLADVHDMILRLPQGYDTTVGGGGVTLSGGMRQRIGLARALFGAPKLIVLDEPSANLDSEGEHALLRALSRLRARGATVIVATHQLNLLKEVDFIAVIVDGKLKSYGPRDEVMKQSVSPPPKALRAI